MNIQTGLGAHPASYTKKTWSFTGVKRQGSGVDLLLPPRAGVKESVELYLYSPSGLSWPGLGPNFTLAMNNIQVSTPPPPPPKRSWIKFRLLMFNGLNVIWPRERKVFVVFVRFSLAAYRIIHRCLPTNLWTLPWAGNYANARCRTSEFWEVIQWIQHRRGIRKRH